MLVFEFEHRKRGFRCLLHLLPTRFDARNGSFLETIKPFEIHEEYSRVLKANRGIVNISSNRLLLCFFQTKAIFDLEVRQLPDGTSEIVEHGPPRFQPMSVRQLHYNRNIGVRPFSFFYSRKAPVLYILEFLSHRCC